MVISWIHNKLSSQFKNIILYIRRHFKIAEFFGKQRFQTQAELPLPCENLQIINRVLVTECPLFGGKISLDYTYPYLSQQG